jgi:sentrin-specific protease 1
MIESHNMKRLKDGQWLSDDIMAYYIMLINARNAADPTLPDIHCFNTFFYSKIDKDPTSHATVRRWTKKVRRTDLLLCSVDADAIFRSISLPRIWYWCQSILVICTGSGRS